MIRLTGAFLLLAGSLQAVVTYTVSTNSDPIPATSGSLRYAMLQAISNTSDADVIIQFDPGLSNIVLSDHLPVLSTQKGTATITVVGENNTIDGNGQWQAFFVTKIASNTNALTVSIQDLTIQNCKVTGGAGGSLGGGAGMGAGAAIFVDTGTIVTADNITFDTCSAVGGAGGSASSTPSGGGGGARGGAGGTGSTSSAGGGGGGGGGFGSSGGSNAGSSNSGGGGGGANIQTGGSVTSTAGGAADSNSTAGGGGGAIGGVGQAASAGGAGGSSGGIGGSGGSSPGGSGGYGGGGAGNYSPTSSGGTTAGAGGFGGGGGGNGGYLFGDAGDGGDFGGGGGNNLGFIGGDGGYGGGGGGGYTSGGRGGFGGGGGSCYANGSVGLGGFGGGRGHTAGIGGGGAGLGGAVFLRSGGTLTLNSCSFSGDSVTGGIGSGGSNGNGSGLGSDLFLQSGDTLIVTGSTTLAGTIYSDGSWTKSGSGILTLTSANTGYSGTITLAEGTIIAGDDDALGSGSFVMSDGAILGFEDLIEISNPITLTGNGNFFVGTGDDATLSSVIAPTTGSFTKTGAGTLLLSGINNYTGGTTLSAGLLQISSASNIGVGSLNFSGGNLESIGNVTTSSNVNVFSSGTLTTDITFTTKFTGVLAGTGGATLTLAGGGVTSLATVNVDSGTFVIAGSTIGGSQNLTKTGSGILQITATNASTGSTTISGGTLLIDSQSNIGSGSVTLSSGILSINTSPVTFSQSFFVTGNSTLTSTGTTTLTGLLTGTGGTTLTLGGSGNSLGKIEVDSGTFTIAGAIGGSQDLVKTGSGGLLLTDASTYSGATTVSEGKLTVTGSTTSSIFVASGALLTGTGTVGSTEVAGTLAGGNPTGTLTVDGTLLFDSESQFATVLSVGTSSLVTATGAVTISPNTTYIIALASGDYGTSTITVLSGSSLTGTFSEVDVNGIAVNFLQANLIYTSTSVELGLVERSVTALATGGNALQVAGALDAAIDYNRNTVRYEVEPGPVIVPTSPLQLPLVLLSLYPTTTEQEVTYALNQLHPAQLKGMGIVQENNAVRVRESLSERMQKVVDEESCNGSPCSSKYHVTTWVAGLGDTLVQDNVNNYWGPLTGYRSNTGGIAIGIDERVADGIFVGALGAYTNSHLHFMDGKGTGNISTGYGGLYFSAFGCGSPGKMFYGNLSVIGGWSQYSNERNIRYGNTSFTATSPVNPGRSITYGIVDLTAKGSHGGSQILSHADTGFNWDIFGLTLRPFDSFDYISQREEKYEESNAGEWELTIEEKNLTMIRNELGLQFAKCYCFGSSKWMVSPKFSWVREIRLKGDHMNMHFTQGGGSFFVESYFPDRNLFAPGLSLTGMMLKDALLFDLYYNGEFTGGYSSNSFGGQASYRF